MENCMNHRVGIVLFLTAVLLGCGGATVTGPSAPEAEPVKILAPIDKTAPVDMWEFMKPTFPSNKQLGSIAYYVEGDNVYQFSWTGANHQHWVHFYLEGDIWLKEDRTWHPEKFYRFRGGLLWVYRYMTIGQMAIDNQAYKVYNYQCHTADLTADRVLPHALTLRDHRYQDFGGDIGEVEVVEVESEGEGYIWGKGLGLLCWHNKGEPWGCSNNFVNITPPYPSGCRVPEGEP